MTKNVGDADRTARLMIGATTSVFYFNHRFTGTPKLLLGLVSLLLLATSLVGWCPVYALLGISTRRPTDAAATHD